MNAYRTGYCDFLFNRECKSPFKQWGKSQQYLKGYLAAKENGVRFDNETEAA